MHNYFLWYILMRFSERLLEMQLCLLHFHIFNSFAFQRPVFPWKFMVGAKFLISQTNQVAGKEQPIKMHDAVP